MTPQDKEIAAKFMGWEYGWQGDYLGFSKPNGSFVDQYDWFPEKGGKDLTELLKRFDLEGVGKLHQKIKTMSPVVTIISESPILFALWFQDENNAPTIFKAVVEVIKEGLE